MEYISKIISFDALVDRSVVIEVCGVVLTCFISASPFLLEVGKRYYIEIIPMIWGEYIVSEVVSHGGASIRRLNDSFSYEIEGLLSDGNIRVSNIDFTDEILLSDYGYLDGKFVKWRIDRLDVDFISLGS